MKRTTALDTLFMRPADPLTRPSDLHAALPSPRDAAADGVEGQKHPFLALQFLRGKRLRFSSREQNAQVLFRRDSFEPLSRDLAGRRVEHHRGYGVHDNGQGNGKGVEHARGSDNMALPGVAGPRSALDQHPDAVTE